jgi:hypothetical protein
LKEDDTPQPIVQQLADKPNSTARQQQLESMITVQLEEQPELEKAFRKLYENISATEEGAKVVNNIKNAKNTNTGNVNTGGGNFRIGDN